MKQLILKNRWGYKLTFEWKGTLIDTLKFAQEYCLENDEVGYFFETKDADQEWLKSSDCPTFVNSYGDEVGPAEEYEIKENEDV